MRDLWLGYRRVPHHLEVELIIRCLKCKRCERSQRGLLCAVACVASMGTRARERTRDWPSIHTRPRSVHTRKHLYGRLALLIFANVLPIDACDAVVDVKPEHTE